MSGRTRPTRGPMDGQTPLTIAPIHRDANRQQRGSARSRLRAVPVQRVACNAHDASCKMIVRVPRCNVQLTTRIRRAPRITTAHHARAGKESLAIDIKDERDAAVLLHVAWCELRAMRCTFLGACCVLTRCMLYFVQCMLHFGMAHVACCASHLASHMLQCILLISCYASC